MNWPRSIAGAERTVQPWFLPAVALLILLGLLVGCGPAPAVPTLAPTIAARQANSSPIAAEAPLSEAEAPPPETSPSPEATAVVQLVTPNAGATGPVPAAAPGIRPSEAQLQRPVEAPPQLGPPGEGQDEDEKTEWRPPPVAVPHALHPDDHYWLARPLPSDKRTYDLEWYPYGNRPRQMEDYRIHHGMDFPNSTGTPIFAAAGGQVVWAGPLRSNRDGVNYYGNTVVIQHDWQWLGQDVYTLYAHTLELFVEVGDVVQQGQLIAGVGASGEVSGPHLHFEVRVGENNYSSTRNPALWLAPYEGWGTLAGRFMDSRGRLIHGAMLTLTPLAVDSGIETPFRRQRTYTPGGVNSDDVWQENFVVGDLPAGEYRLVLTTAGQTFRRTVRVRPGLTNYVIFQADFVWTPTATPTPTPTATPTPAPSATATLEG